MSLDPVLLSRFQFALTIMFHYLFPPLTIGLGALLVCMEGAFLRTRNAIYESMARFWTRIFAVNFAMGVATGIVMEFQFGTNWSGYSRFVGDVFGSALAAEGIFAFFLESGFLAVLVFGWDRVSPRLHFFSTVMVALGSIFSAVWIVVANSWQQTPAGHEIVPHDGGMRAEIVDFWAMVLNPSSLHRLNHVLLGSFILGAFFVLSISAWYALRGRHREFARRSFGIALPFGLATSLLAPVSGHFQAEMVAEHQPAKLAAFEAHFHTGDGGAAMHLWGVVDEDGERVKYGLAVPGLLSFLVHGDPEEPVPGLDRFRPEERPPVAIPFYAYHAMVGLGVVLVLLATIGLYFQRRGRLLEQRWLLWILVGAVLGPYAANQLGWVAAEVGRQPWVVHGLLRTADGISPSVSGGEVLASIVLFAVIYALLFLVYLYVLNDKIQHGPDPVLGVPEGTSPEDLLEAAARRSNPAGWSMTEAKGPPPGGSGEPL